MAFYINHQVSFLKDTTFFGFFRATFHILYEEGKMLISKENMNLQNLLFIF